MRKLKLPKIHWDHFLVKKFENYEPYSLSSNRWLSNRALPDYFIRYGLLSGKTWIFLEEQHDYCVKTVISRIRYHISYNLVWVFNWSSSWLWPPEKINVFPSVEINLPSSFSNNPFALSSALKTHQRFFKGLLIEFSSIISQHGTIWYDRLLWLNL